MGWGRCCELLGVGEGAAPDEIKAAYRDMAKVWHPDRFTHDPRLQQKAQERLKEINEAYRQLLDGAAARSAPRPSSARPSTHAARAPRPADPPRADVRQAGATWDYTPTPAPPDNPPARGRRLDPRLLVAAVVFCATFAFFTPRLLSSYRAATRQGGAETTPQEQPSDAVAAETREQPAGAAAQKGARAQRPAESAPRAGQANAAPATLSEAAARAPLPTVSVTVDPATNLLARPGCPHKLRVTFPAGDEPRAHCDAAHASAEAPAGAPEKAQGKSRLKSLAGRLASPSKWLPGGKDAPAQKPSAQGQSPEPE